MYLNDIFFQITIILVIVLTISIYYGILIRRKYLDLKKTTLLLTEYPYNENILIGDENQKILELSDLPPFEFNYEEIIINNKIKNKLNDFLSPIVQQLPSIGMTAHHMRSYIATFSPDLLAGLNSGTLKLMPDSLGGEILIATKGGRA